nr:RNA-directed DNA polymerase, eukaryota [Tanacetum cinerariifolium]
MDKCFKGTESFIAVYIDDILTGMRLFLNLHKSFSAPTANAAEVPKNHLFLSTPMLGLVLMRMWLMGETLDLEDNVDTSFGCKRLCVKTAHPVLISETFKIIVKGRVFLVRAKELFTWNPSFIDNKEKDYASEEESDFVPNNNDPNNHINEEVFGDVYGSDDDGVPETMFGPNISSPN